MAQAELDGKCYCPAQQHYYCLHLNRRAATTIILIISSKKFDHLVVPASQIEIFTATWDCGELQGGFVFHSFDIILTKQ